jgi:putative lipoic acid-binding regulatory protein
MFRPINGKLQIEYPCTWIYKIFGTDQAQMCAAVAGIIPGEDYSLTPSNSSRTGKYHCINLAITVSNEQERTGIYEALRGHSAIVLVL